MTPIKAKSLLSKTAEQSGFSEELVTTVVNTFYKGLREKLTNMEFKKIVIDNLGAFYIKERLTENYRKRYEITLEKLKLKESSIKIEILTREFEAQLQKIQKVQTQIKEDKERKQFFILHKQKLNEETTGNLG